MIYKPSTATENKGELTELNHIYTLFNEKGGAGIVELLDSSMYLTEINSQYELLDKVTYVYKINNEDKVILFVVANKILWWAKQADIEIIAKFIYLTNCINFKFGYAAGTQHPLIVGKGFISSTLTEGYNLWISN